MRLRRPVSTATIAIVLAVPGQAAARPGAEGPEPLPRGSALALVGYRSDTALRAALIRHPARIVRILRPLRIAEVRPAGPVARFAASVRALPGIVFVQRPRRRASTAEPALLASQGGAHQWQWYATQANAVPAWALRAAGSVTIAVIDTGADLSAPDLAAKSPLAFDLETGSADVRDTNGHGTFVSSIAAGSVTNGDGIAGSGGDARLVVIKAGSGRARFTDLDEARAILAAVDRGARIVNLSFGGARTSATEQRAIEYAAERGVLLVAAVGNEYERGNAVQYPAALLQPEGSDGQGGLGLAVAASTAIGKRAYFSNTGSYISLAAPGEAVFGAVSALSSPASYPRVPLQGSLSGVYGYGSGTSFAAPQVSGAAAIVWGANPMLTAGEVAQILKETARGAGRWSPELGWGVIDVAAAVARATGKTEEAAADLRPTTQIRLAASAATVRGAGRVALTATLDGDSEPREVVLELLRQGAWKPAGRAVTDGEGKATWRVALGPGRHRLRARHETLVSRPVAISVRS